MISWLTTAALGLLTAFRLGPAFFQADVKEVVTFEKDGSGQATLEVRLKDARPELIAIYGCTPATLHRVLDSAGRKLNVIPQSATTGLGIQDWHAGYDSLKNLLSISFTFSNPEQLNFALSCFTPENSGDVYVVGNNTITRSAVPLFLGKSLPLTGNLSAPRKGFYHEYRLRIGLPAGIKKVKIENRNPSAFIEDHGQSVTIETDISKLTSSQILGTDIWYKTY